MSQHKNYCSFPNEPCCCGLHGDRESRHRDYELSQRRMHIGHQYRAMLALLKETVDVLENEDCYNHDVSGLRLKNLLEKIKTLLKEAKEVKV